ncbi:unnamed protein product [Brassica oleracea var. botrytis]
MSLSLVGHLFLTTNQAKKQCLGIPYEDHIAFAQFTSSMSPQRRKAPISIAADRSNRSFKRDSQS